MSNNNLIPNISWYQNSTHLFVEVLLPECKNINVIFTGGEDGKFKFEGEWKEKKYGIEFEWFSKIVEGFSTFKTTDTKVLCMIKKEDEDFEWSRLTKTKDLYKNSIKVNWDRMDFEDDEQPEEYGDMMSQMQQMQMMGGGMGGGMNMMGGMPGGMGGMDMSKMMEMMQGMNINGDDSDENNNEDMMNMMQSMQNGEIDKEKLEEMLLETGGEEGKKVLEMLRGPDGQIDPIKMQQFLKDMQEMEEQDFDEEDGEDGEDCEDGEDGEDCEDGEDGEEEIFEQSA